MTSFCLLKDPGLYVAQDWDLLADQAGRDFWLAHFENQFAATAGHAAQQYGRTAGKRIAAASAEFAGLIQKLRADPASLDGKLNIMVLDAVRRDILRKHGLDDPYTKVKTHANAAATEVYPQLIRKVRAIADDRQRWLYLVKCVMAGNIFDTGSPATMNLSNDPKNFLSALEKVKPRPWLADDFDALVEDLCSAPPSKWSKVVVFVDNAGADFILGLMPLVRELALDGAKIVLAANERPALNDMTVDETIDVIDRLAVTDADLAALIKANMLEVLASGSDLPLLDLSEVSEPLNEAADDAELVILEGMGRAVETNYDAAFKVDSLRLALLKNETLATHVGGQLFDCICKYTRPGR